MRLALMCVALPLLSACLEEHGSEEQSREEHGSEAEPSLLLARHAAAVVGGSASGTDQNSVVLLVRGFFAEICTGTVVAPDLILTARHCLFKSSETESGYTHCERSREPPIVLTAYEPADLGVYVGNAKPLPLEPVAVGSAVYSGADLNLCNNDLALLATDRPLPLDPLPMRLDEEASVGETGVLVGWGKTAPNGPSLADARQQREIRIDAVGPATFEPGGRSPREIRASLFAGSEGGCLGDSGGPLISTESGAIIGVMSEIGNVDATLGFGRERADETCVAGGISEFQRLDIQQEWLREAFSVRGAAPWLENKQRPAPPGEACGDADECSSGICARIGAEQLCSQDCDTAACPDGMECVGVSGQRLCVPLDVPGVEARAAGCSQLWWQPARGRALSAQGACALLLLVLLRQSIRRWQPRGKRCDPFS
jgi:hypothetical protein